MKTSKRFQGGQWREQQFSLSDAIKQRSVELQSSAKSKGKKRTDRENEIAERAAMERLKKRGLPGVMRQSGDKPLTQESREARGKWKIATVGMNGKPHLGGA